MPIDTSRAYGVGRVTPQRRLIAEAASSMPGAFTIEELERTIRRLG